MNDGIDQIDGNIDAIKDILNNPDVDEKDRQKAERVLQKSESACLISNSIKSKIVMVTTINLA